MLRSGIVVCLLVLFSVDPNVLIAQDSRYRAAHATKDGQYLVAVYIGAQSCGPCHLPENIAAIERLKVTLSRMSKEQGWHFRVVGVALDHDVEEGYRFLRANGEFDELVVGGSWINLGAESHIWARPEVAAVIPQVLLYKQVIDQGGDGIAFGDRKNVTRLFLRTVRDWLDSDGSLEDIFAVNDTVSSP
jgi:hypothetical protein